MPKKVEPNFVNGWASATRGSSHKHLLVYPVDLGDREPALCGVVPPLGWTEPETAEQWWCHTCLNRYRLMYEDDDPRLTVEDRQSFRTILNAYDESLRKQAAQEVTYD